jgi:glycosyltransferase involved in cell wall biosynthesis
MKILQLHTRYRQAGGEDSVVAAEAAALRSAGHEVTQLLFENPDAPVRTVFSLARAGWNTASARRASTVARADHPDVAHLHNTWYAASQSVLKAFADEGLPVVMTLHNYRLLCVNGMLFRDGRPCETCVGTHAWHGVRHRCYRSSAAQSAVLAANIGLHRGLDTWDRVDRFLVLSEFARSRFIAGGLPAERLVTVPNFVDDPGPRRNAAAHSTTVLFVGRLSPEKGVSLLLDAWERASPKGLQLLVVGDGPERGRLEARQVKGVRLLGRQPPEVVREHMLSSRALLFPSIWYEGQPMTILEALAAGLPVLASNLGGAGETVADLGSAWQVPAGDVEAWVFALQALDSDATVTAGSASARQVFEDRHTVAHGVDRLVEVYGGARVAAKGRG